MVKAKNTPEFLKKKQLGRFIREILGYTTEFRVWDAFLEQIGIRSWGTEGNSGSELLPCLPFSLCQMIKHSQSSKVVAKNGATSSITTGVTIASLSLPGKG